jgi:hypothetical protein
VRVREEGGPPVPAPSAPAQARDAEAMLMDARSKQAGAADDGDDTTFSHFMCWNETM